MKKLIQKLFGIDKLIVIQEKQLKKQEELCNRVLDVQRQMIDIQRNQTRI